MQRNFLFRECALVLQNTSLKYHLCTELKHSCSSVPRALWRYLPNACGYSFVRSPQEKHLALAGSQARQCLLGVLLGSLGDFD